MQAIVAEFRIMLDAIEAFERAIVWNASASRETEPGCRQVDVCLDAADPAPSVRYQLYDDVAPTGAHLRSEQFRAMSAASAGRGGVKTINRVAP